MAGQVGSSARPQLLSSIWQSSNLSPAAALLAYVMLMHAFLSSVPWQSLMSLGPSQAASLKAAEPDGSYFFPMAVLVQPHGYRLQEHFVTTKDGFILRMFRIPGRMTNTLPGSTSNSSCSDCHSIHLSSTPATCSSCHTHNSKRSSTQRLAVFLQHALMDSSAGWLLLGPGRALALQLVDAGFDVWMGNARGNRYSRNHTTLTPDQPAFWAWSWQKQAEFDLPASINYALQVTQQQKLMLVGYSQGSMSSLAALASQPQLAASVSLGIMLAPVAFTTGMTSPSFVLSSKLGLDTYGLSQGWMEWGSHQPYWGRMCGHVPQLCLHFLTSLCGQNPSGNVEPGLIPTIFQHLPAGTSVQGMSHWAQGIRRRDSRLLHAFDYGTDCSTSSTSNSSSSRCNQVVYGQRAPPSYDVANVTVPFALFSGGQDTISTLPDVELLKQRLRPGVLVMHKHFPSYGHLDFELGTDAATLLYPTLLELARQYAGMA